LSELPVATGVACVNKACPDYGATDRGNVVVRRTYGEDVIRFVRCTTCKAEFSERHGTALFDVRIRKEKVIEVVKHLAEGTGVRRTARLTGVSRGADGRILKRVGDKAKEIHDELVRDLEVPEVQMDEMWAFVGKKTRTAPRRRGQRER
jgi:LacI family transcriptional regulator